MEAAAIPFPKGRLLRFARGLIVIGLLAICDCGAAPLSRREIVQTFAPLNADLRRCVDETDARWTPMIGYTIEPDGTIGPYLRSLNAQTITGIPVAPATRVRVERCIVERVARLHFRPRPGPTVNGTWSPLLEDTNSVAKRRDDLAKDIAAGRLAPCEQSARALIAFNPMDLEARRTLGRIGCLRGERPLVREALASLPGSERLKLRHECGEAAWTQIAAESR